MINGKINDFNIISLDNKNRKLFFRPRYKFRVKIENDGETNMADEIGNCHFVYYHIQMLCMLYSVHLAQPLRI